MKKISVILLALLFLPGFLSAKKYNLEYNLKKGDSYTVRNLIEMNIGQEIQGQPFDINMSMDMSVNYEIADVSKGLITMKVKYEEFAMTMGMPQGNISFSSSDEPAEEGTPEAIFQKLFSSFNGKSFTVKMNSKGVVNEVDGINKIINGMLEDIVEIASPENKDKAQSLVNEYFKEFFNNEKFSESMEQMTAILPDGKVEIGESWFKDFNTELMQKMNMKNKYTLLNADNDTYTLDISSNVDMVNNMGMINQEISGKQTGSILLDKKSCWIKSGLFEMQAEGVSKVESNGQIMEIPMTMDMMLKYETIKK
jgi:hypothetical protein